jgi:hypothetical protein
MSGGHFNYEQDRINDIADAVDDLIANNEGDREYRKSVINEFKIGLDHLRKAAIYAQRIDWLVSEDDGEESFLMRLRDELQGLDNKQCKKESSGESDLPSAHLQG